MSENAKARLALAVVCLLWGTTYFAIHVAVQNLPPTLFCAVRFLMAGGALLPYALWRGEKLPRGRDWFDLAAISVMLLTLGNGALAWAEQWVPTGIASLIIVTTPLWMGIFARISGESVRPRAAAGLIVGFLGLAVLLWPDIGRGHGGSGFIWGVAALFFSSIVWSFGSIYAKRRPPRTGPLMTIAVEMLVGCVIFSAIGLLAGHASRWHPTRASWLALVYLAIFGSIIGYRAYLYALSHLPTVQASLYAYVNPIVAMLLGALFLGERFDSFLIIGACLVLVGVYLVNSSASQRKLLLSGRLRWPRFFKESLKAPPEAPAL